MEEGKSQHCRAVRWPTVLNRRNNPPKMDDFTHSGSTPLVLRGTSRTRAYFSRIGEEPCTSCSSGRFRTVYRGNNWIYIFMYRTRLLTWLDTFVSLYFDAVFATFLLLFHLWPGGNAGCLCFYSPCLSLITTRYVPFFVCYHKQFAQ